ncbi:MAG: hypothetical protein II931_02760 [Clostridia bacterium]|nr:hypothetical protein [Clostridia bacterium]
MTDERLDQILRQALAPTIDDTDIQIKKKVRSNSMKHTFKICTAAACAALIAAAGIGGSLYLSNQPEPASNSESSVLPDENVFTLKVNAEELEKEKGVPVDFGAAHKSASLNGSNDRVSYSIATGFNCEGSGIESITYSINKGAFQIVENPDASIITSGKRYEGTLNVGQVGDGESTNYYTEYTLGYDAQSNDTTCINICGEVVDSHVYNEVFGCVENPENYNPQTVADGYTDMLKDVEITCTVHYTDGTSASENIIIEGQVMTLEETKKILGEKELEYDYRSICFVFKLK